MTEPGTPAGAPEGAGPGSGAATGWIPPAGASPLVGGQVEVVPAAAVPVVETVDEVALLVRAVSGVVDLHPGRFGEVATYLPGRRVTGIKLNESVVEIHVVASLGIPLRSLAQQVHAAVAAVVDVPVEVFIEDIAAPAAA